MEWIRAVGVMALVLGSMTSCGSVVFPPLMADASKAHDIHAFLPSALAILAAGAIVFVLGHLHLRIFKHHH